MNPTYTVETVPLGDLLDFVDPFGIHHIPENLAKVPAALAGKVEHAAARAASNAASNVGRTITHVADEAKHTAIVIAACSALAVAVAGGVYLYARHRPIRVEVERSRRR